MVEIAGNADVFVRGNECFPLSGLVMEGMAEGAMAAIIRSGSVMVGV